MKFNEIISISGKSGLYRLLNTRPDGIIVQSLEDGKSNFISTRIHNIITLDNIAIFRENEETTPLRDVFISMKDQEADVNVPDPGSDEKNIRSYLEKILPDYDKQRVHTSDMKKLVKWYHILKQKDSMPEREEESKAKESAQSDEENATAKSVSKPKKTKAKAIGTDDEAGTPAVTEEKPKRKAAAKKKSDGSKE